MGFRSNSYATFWGEPKRISETLTTGRISMSRKDKVTGEFKTTFSGGIGFHGTSAANKALQLKEGDRLHLIDVDVENDKIADLPDGKKYKFYRFKVWNFEKVEPLNGDGGEQGVQQSQRTPNYQSVDVLVDNAGNGDDLPF